MVEPNPTSPEPLRLGLLETARLNGRERLGQKPLERKIAAVLAYLALEGATPRSKIAGLLWPGSPESTARNNLAQALRRLKQASGTELISGGDVLSLQHLHTDIAELELAYFAGHHPTVIQTEGQLLGSYEYDDCPDFDDWLIAKREYLSDLRRKSLMALAEAEEKNANYRAALGWVERLLEADPLSEVAHRQAMRLWYLLGDRAAALQAYHRCQEVLRKELGVDPLPETQALARQIDQGQGLGQTAAPGRSEIPLNLLRPPQLVGRGAVWAQLEEAYRGHRVVFLRGEPGVGKTRLATDFAASKGRVVLLSARPGDASVPFSSYARSLRETFAGRPELADELPRWVRLELSRIVPELSGQTPPPLASEADTLRFYDALSQLALVARSEQPSIQVSDDAQYLDRASIEATIYQLNKFGGVGREGQPPFTIQIYRRGEIAPEIERELFLPLVDRGLAVLIDLEPLPPSALEQLVESLGVEGLSGLSQNLSRYTGGNPFFLLETARSLLESGNLHGQPQKLPTSGKVRGLIQRRLERLSSPALNLAQTAAVAAGDFSLELAVQVLQTSPFALAEPIAELEAAQILKGNAFVHDLLYEATLDSVPASIKGYLHRQIAGFLESHQAEPARIAGHWLEGGEAGKAAPLLLEAAASASKRFRLEETLALYQNASEVLENLGNPDAAFEATWAETRLLDNVAPNARHQQAVERLSQLAQTPAQRAKALMTQGRWLTMFGKALEGEQATRQGYSQAHQSGDAALEVELQNLLAINLWYQDRYPESIPLLELSVKTSLALGMPQLLAPSTGYLGAALVFLDRHHEARRNLLKAAELMRLGGEKPGEAQTLTTVVDSYILSGLPQQALATALEAQAALEGVTGASERLFTVRYSLADSYFHTAQYAESLQVAEQALEELGADDHRMWGAMHHLLARTKAALGADAEALEHLEQAKAHKAALPRRTVMIWMLEATIRARQGEKVEGLLEQIQQATQPHWPASMRCNLLLQRSALVAPKQGYALAQEGLRLAEAFGLEGLRISCKVRLAQLALSLGNPQEAFKQIEEALQLSTTHHPSFLYPLEVGFTLYQVAHKLGLAEARGYLEALSQELQEAAQKVPQKYQGSFLEGNPTNKAIVEAARGLGLT